MRLNLQHFHLHLGLSRQCKWNVQESPYAMGVTLEIGTSRSGNLLLQALIEVKKSYFCCISFKFSCPKRCSLIGWIIIKLTISVS